MSGAAVIVGASHGGVQAAVSLRQAGWQEPIHLLSDEPDLPYHRPPLSKAYLAGQKSEEQIMLRSEAFYSQQGIDLRLDEPVLKIDTRSSQIASTKDRIGYSRLLLATGSVARHLNAPGTDLAGVMSLRDLGDARRLSRALGNASSVAVVGGGFIGLEVAATAVASGKKVTIIEMQERLLTRSLPAGIAGFIADYHAEKGASLLFGTGVSAIEGSHGQACAVRLSDGRLVEADLVLIGIGGISNLELVERLGLTEAAGGVLVDEHGRTSLPDIYAIGDMTASRNFCSTEPVRLESVQNAVDQAKAAGTHMAGGSAPVCTVPWFWTDQYDLKIQMAGLPVVGAVELVRGNPRDDAFSVLQIHEGRLTALFSVNRPADHMAARKLIAAGVPINGSLASDIDVPLMRHADTAAR